MGSCISPVRSGSTGSWRSSCCRRTTPVIRTYATVSCAKRAPPRSSAIPTSSRFSRSTRSAPSCSSPWVRRRRDAHRAGPPPGAAPPSRRDACCGSRVGTGVRALARIGASRREAGQHHAGGGHRARARRATSGSLGRCAAPRARRREVIGTPEFMSPEQALGEHVDGAATCTRSGSWDTSRCRGSCRSSGESDRSAREADHGAGAAAGERRRGRARRSRTRSIAVSRRIPSAGPRRGRAGRPAGLALEQRRELRSPCACS